MIVFGQSGLLGVRGAGGVVCLRGRTKDMPRERRKKKKTPITSLSRSEPKVLQSIKFTAIVWKHPCEIRVLQKLGEWPSKKN